MLHHLVSTHRRIVATAICALVMSGMGCLQNTVSDDFSTELTVFAPGTAGQAYEIRKRFRFSRSPQDARAIRLESAFISVVEPEDIDLSFIQSITVYVELENGERVWLATGGGFGPDERFGLVTDTNTDDLRAFVRPDARITLVFEVTPSSWYRNYPEGGITLLAKASLIIEI